MVRLSNLHLAVCLFCACFFSQGEGRQLPNFVKTCSRNNPDMPGCLAKSMDMLRPYLIKGIPEMGVPPMDPLIIPQLVLETGNGTNFGYKVVMTNLVFIGGKDFEVEAVESDIKKGIFKLTMNIPVFYVSSHYESEGRVLLIRFEGEGPMYSNFTGVKIKGEWEGTKIMKKGKEHFVFSGNRVEVDVKQVTTRFEDLFKGNPELTEGANRVFNENSDALYEEIKPVVGSGIKELITSVLNKVHELYSNDVLYPE